MNTNNHAIFWIMEKNGKELVTLNKSKENKYRIWKPYRSKLAAAIINGIEIFPILKKSKILYYDTFMENTVNHISDIIGMDGKIFIPKNYVHSNFLQNINSDVTNILIINDIKKSTIDVLTVSEILDNNDKNSISISFDDGWEGAFNIAMPIIK